MVVEESRNRTQKLAKFALFCTEYAPLWSPNGHQFSEKEQVTPLIPIGLSRWKYIQVYTAETHIDQLRHIFPGSVKAIHE